MRVYVDEGFILFAYLHIHPFNRLVDERQVDFLQKMIQVLDEFDSIIVLH